MKSTEADHPPVKSFNEAGSENPVLVSGGSPSNMKAHVKQELKDFIQHTHSYSTSEETLNLILVDCVRENMTELVVKLLTEGCNSVFVNVNYRTFEGETLLHIASEMGFLATCEALLDYGKIQSLDMQDNGGRTPLHLACQNNYYSIVRLFIRSGANFDIRDSKGNTPLHYVVLNKNMDIFFYLLKRDAKLNIKNESWMTPIELARKDQWIQSICVLNIVDPAVQPEGKVLDDSDVESDISGQISSIMLQEEPNNSFFTNFEDEEPMSLDDFETVKVIKKLARGDAVYLVKNNKNSRFYAMKVLKRPSLQGAQLFMKCAFTERNVLGAVSSPFIVKLHSSYQSDSYIYFILDYSRCGDLQSLLKKQKKFPEDSARLYMSEIIVALEELHKNDIVYRNLKLENIGIDETGHVQLTNFGLSKENLPEGCTTNSFFSSFTQYPPEVIESEGHGRTVDFYMLGGLLFQMIVGRLAFSSGNQRFLIDQIKYSPIELPEEISEETGDFITSLMSKEPGGRLDLNSVKSHIFFKRIDWDEVKRRELEMPLVGVEENSLTPMGSTTTHTEEWEIF